MDLYFDIEGVFETIDFKIREIKISAIIVIYNGMQRDWIQKCFESVLNSSLPIDIIAVDNGSTDGSVELIQHYYPRVDLIISNENVGFGKANNVGIKKAFDNKAEYVFLLNQDAWLEKETIEKLIDIAVKYPEYGIISPMQMNGTGVGLDLNFSRILSDEYTAGFTNDLYMKQLKPVYDTSFVMAAMWLITRHCYNTVGLFEPLFPHYGEDSDYLKRVSYHKLKAGICTLTTIYHDRESRMLKGKVRTAEGIYIVFLAAALNITKPLISALVSAYTGMLRNAVYFIFKAELKVFKFLFQSVLVLPAIIKARSKNKFIYIHQV